MYYSKQSHVAHIEHFGKGSSIVTVVKVFVVVAAMVEAVVVAVAAMEVVVVVLVVMVVVVVVFVVVFKQNFNVLNNFSMSLNHSFITQICHCH